MFDLKENYTISRKLASEGMVLLKNEDNTLPLKKNCRVGILGKECLDLIRGGGGSAAVKCIHVKSLIDGLLEKESEDKIILSKESVTFATEQDNYSIEDLNSLSQSFDTAIVTLKRYAGEGNDRKLGTETTLTSFEGIYTGESNEEAADDYEKKTGYFYPSMHELELLAKIEKSHIKKVVLILNIAAVIDISFIDSFKKIKAVLLTFLPGMEAGCAVSDILCGDVNPSGKLTDTIAYKYSDYPSSPYYNTDENTSLYKEDIFVGYRYFETYAPEKVMFPFGFGLSYTQFDFSEYTFTVDDCNIQVEINVKNIGEYPGKEVIQIYSSSPAGKLEKPTLELRGFAKTGLLMPGEHEKVIVSFDRGNMASFDADGVTGHKAAWVLEKGVYTIFAGNSVRNIYPVGTYCEEETFVTSRLSSIFDGNEYTHSVSSCFSGKSEYENQISLYDVHEGKYSIYDFIKQLSVKELISLAQGQPPAFPLGTAGIGNLKSRGVPNPQTADGPAGVRRSVNTTCFPCGTLVACSWNEKLLLSMGKALGKEGVSTGIDILLAPSMNIHRNPLCGRNFEYLSEDPLITGKTASAIVKGIQSEGLCATVKHFAANNCELNRKKNDSCVSERALREIYLKGFEIAIKESRPDFVMTSYNKLNGKHISENARLLRGVLRDEWGYTGAIMTDWRNEASLGEEIRSGNNIKMPFGYPDHAEKALEEHKNGKLPIELLRENAYYVLTGVMKTNCFKEKNFGNIHTLTNGKSEIPAILVNGISSTRIMQATQEDGTEYLYQLNLDQRMQRTFIYYSIVAPSDGKYSISAKVSANFPGGQILYCDEADNIKAVVTVNSSEDFNWQIVDSEICLNKGNNILKLIFAANPQQEHPFFDNWYGTPKEDFRLAKIILTKKECAD